MRKGSERVLHNSGPVQKLAIILASKVLCRLYLRDGHQNTAEDIPKSKELGHIGVALRFWGVNKWCLCISLVNRN